MATPKTCVLALFLVLATVDAASVSVSVQEKAGATEKDGFGANPIRRVVNMLQMMQKKVEAEGKKEEELFDKFMCYCETSGTELAKSLDEATGKISQLESDIKEAQALKVQLEAEVKQHQKDRADAKVAIEKATSIREKEHKEFAAEDAETKSNIDALGRAIPAIEKGMAGAAFLQTSFGNKLKALVESAKVGSLSDYDRDELVSFLSGKAQDGYAPAGGEILGILKQMKDEMEADLAELVADEQKATTEFNELLAAKEKEIAAASKAIEEKLGRLGEVGVQLASMGNDLEDTSESLADDKKFLADMEKNCESKKKEYACREKTRSEEILAIAETIKLLNDDDALELFKKTLPSAAAFVQVDATATQVRREALKVIKGAQKRATSRTLDLIAIALSGKKVNFDKVLKMIDDMVVLLKQEQTDDNDKKEYCEIEIDLTEDKIKESQHAISDLETKVADTEEAIKTTMDEIKALKDGITALDRSVVEATEQRKDENSEYTGLMAGNTAAAELIGFAKNRMNKFYNPKMYKAPPKRELTEEERITLNMGGTLEPTAPPGGIAGTGIGLVQAHSQAAPPPPPDSFGSCAEYGAKGEESNGVIAMMDMMVADLEKEMTEARVEEENAQEEYEQFMADSKEKRAADSKSVVDKEAQKANLDSELQMAKDSKNAEEKELAATKQYLADVHADCDWLIENFDARKQARAEEIDALGKAKAVLSGADFSLIQTAATTSTKFLGLRK